MNRLIRLALGLVLVAAVAVAATGCGDTAEKNDYVDQVNEIQTNLQTEATTEFSQAPTNPAQAGEFVKKLQELFANAADDLEAVEPPEDVADLHAQLVAAVRGVSDDIGKVVDAFDSGDPAEIRQAATDLQTAITSSQTEFSSLIDQINATLQG